MNSQLLFWIYLIAGIVLLFVFLSGRKSSREPTKLNLRAGEPPSKPKSPMTKAPTAITSRGAKVIPLPLPERGTANSQPHPQPHPLSPSKPMVEVMEPVAESPVAPPPNAASKNLNCLFMYNGHDWDAYQVLGVAAGSPLPIVTQAYQDIIKSSNPSSYEFFEAAYKAILKSSQGYRL